MLLPGFGPVPRCRRTDSGEATEHGDPSPLPEAPEASRRLPPTPKRVDRGNGRGGLFLRRSINGESRLKYPIPSVQPLGEPSGDPDFTPLAQGALPDDRNSPACLEELALSASVPFHVGIELGLPELRAGARRSSVRAAGMAVPEAAVNEAHRSESPKHQVGSAGEFPVVQTVPETERMDGPSEYELGNSVPASDPRHHARTGRPIDNIRHGQLLPILGHCCKRIHGKSLQMIKLCASPACTPERGRCLSQSHCGLARLASESPVRVGS